MPIRIRLFLIILGISLLPLVFVFFQIPHLSQTLFTNSGAPLLLMLFMLIILITLAALFMAVHFTLPLTQLREIAQKVQAGEFDERANFKKGDEIGELAQAFNTMLDAFQNQQLNLQSAVTHATSELNEKVDSLEDTKKASLNLLEDLEEEKGELGEARSKDEAILASIGDGLIAIDEDGKVIIINQAGCDLLMYKKEELLGKKLVEMVEMVDENGNVVPKDKRPAQMSISHGKFTTTTGSIYQYIRKDKTQLPIAITITPIISNGQTIGAIEVFRDITREKEIDRSKSEFVSLASHQLRTPLGIVKWYLEAFENEDYFKNAPEEIRKYFNEIYKSNERVLSLVRDLLSVSRIDQGKVKDAPKPVDVTAVVTDIVEQMKIMAIKKKITLKLTVAPEKVPEINIDELRFHEVVENLVINAIDYTRANGTVEVSVKIDGDKVFISVKDSGIGISKNDQKKLFTKFFRSEKAVSQNPEGSGLGLYVVKSYVEGWGGNISVQSVEEKGTTIIISIPVS